MSRARAAGPVPVIGWGNGRTRLRTGCSTPAPARRGPGPGSPPVLGGPAQIVVGARHAGAVAQFFGDGEESAIAVLGLAQPPRSWGRHAELMVDDRHAGAVAEVFFDGEGFAIPVHGKQVGIPELAMARRVTWLFIAVLRCADPGASSVTGATKGPWRAVGGLEARLKQTNLK